MTRLPNVVAAEPIPEEAAEAVRTLLESGDLFRYTSGARSPVALLEREFAEMIGARYALAVSSCSAALFLSLRALDLAPGARVLVPAFTFAAVPSAVVHAGCSPVLVNVGADYRIDLDDFRRRLDDGADAVLISHMRGHTSDMDAISSACAARGLALVEDAAHSLGTTWRGRPIGTLGAVGCFSFQSYKLLNAGEGGMLITDDADLIARAVVMSGAYEDNWRKHPVVGDRCAAWRDRLPLYNVRLNNLSAAIVRAQLKEVPRRVADGRRNHDHAAARLSAEPWFDVPAALPGEARAPDSIQFNIVGVGDDALVRRFTQAADARGLNIQVFGLSDGNARAFWNWRFLPRQAGLKPTKAMLRRACDVRLPARLSLDEVDTIVDVVIAAANETLATAIGSAA
ncbi:MAG: aminotransferase class I/II-fold pyridoxal phosphate-dependent enzyme [Pseudomonadota bacterium]